MDELLARLKPVIWIASSKRDLQAMPDDIQQTFGYALFLAQTGSRHRSAKPLRGFGSAGVLGVVADARGSTYRAVYTVRLGSSIYVLHCFQKKSNHGIATPQPDVELIRQRLQWAEAHSRGRH